MQAEIPHFWKMVWEQKSQVIVMLLDKSSNQLKGNQYWPMSNGMPVTYGDFTVKTINSTKFNKCTIRDFVLTMGNRNRRVIHFSIHAWRQGSAGISPDDILSFVWTVRERMTAGNTNPLIVQCSSDAGRMGTYIALDYFNQRIETQSLDDDIDVFQYVLQMRESRKNMVKDESQYIFIFDALSELLRMKVKADRENLYESLYTEADNTDEAYVIVEMKKNTSVYANVAYENE